MNLDWISWIRAAKSEASDTSSASSNQSTGWKNNQLKYFTNIAGYSGVRFVLNFLHSQFSPFPRLL